MNTQPRYEDLHRAVVKARMEGMKTPFYIYPDTREETAMLESGEPEVEDVNREFKVNIDDSSRDGVRYLSASAGTGWRYTIVIAPLPIAGVEQEGGPMLVTVLSPWVDTWALQRAGHLSEKYVAEHLGGLLHQRNAADIRAMTLLVRKGLNREGDLS